MKKWLKKIVEILIIILFFLQGTTKYAIQILFVQVLLLSIVFYRNHSSTIKFPNYLKIAITSYAFFLIIGIINGHPAAHIDIKFQIFSFIFYLTLLNFFDVDWLKILLKINFITFIIYLLLYINIFPNFWSDWTFGNKGRLYGPPIFGIILITFIYLYQKRQWDRKYVISFIMGFVYIGLTTNFMNLMILGLLSLLLVIDVKKLLKPKFIVLFVVAIFGMLAYVQSSYAPELLRAKAAYILDPLEYSSFKIRVIDLKQALNNENFTFLEKIFGEGFGVSSEIYRENKIATSLSRTINFQEIDNGFYYLYHRGGWLLLTLFIISHFYLITIIKSNKAKLGFFIIVLITNLLTIHYFNYYFYLLLPFLILKKNTIRNP